MLLVHNKALKKNSVASVDFSEARWFMGGVVHLLGNENMDTGLLYP